MTWCEQLKAFWREHGLLRNEGASESTLLAFESNYSVKMPLEFVEYFSHLNGMINLGGGDVDKNGFSFLPLNKVQPVTLFSSKMNWKVDNRIDHNSTFVFIDYLQWCYAYAFDAAPERSGIIYQLGTEVNEVAPSLKKFVELYLQDDNHIHNPIT